MPVALRHGLRDRRHVSMAAQTLGRAFAKHATVGVEALVLMIKREPHRGFESIDFA